MAATIAKCRGIDRNREKFTSRIGSAAAEGSAATWHTTATAHVRADGSGWVEVRRFAGAGGPVKTLHEFVFGPEGVDEEA